MSPGLFLSGDDCEMENDLKKLFGPIYDPVGCVDVEDCRCLVKSNQSSKRTFPQTAEKS